MNTATDRQQYREVLADLAAKASETLPAGSAGRIACAVRLVLAGDVTMQSDGTALVAQVARTPRRSTASTGPAPVPTFPAHPPSGASMCDSFILN
jgi:hypothetical protein